jgi:hypothetical protein
MDTDYIADRVNQILRQKIAMGGAIGGVNFPHRFSNSKCSKGKESKTGKYWAEYKKGKKNCITYAAYLKKRKPRKTPVLKKGPIKRKYKLKYKLGPETKKCRAACRKIKPVKNRIPCMARCSKTWKGKGGGCDCESCGGIMIGGNPWMHFLREFREEYPETRYMPQSQVLQLASEAYHGY